jgi:hypothetical protein
MKRVTSSDVLEAKFSRKGKQKISFFGHKKKVCSWGEIERGAGEACNCALEACREDVEEWIVMLYYALEVFGRWSGRKTEDVGFVYWVGRPESKDEEGLGREGVRA